MKWTTDTDYGTLDVTINLSKPEKDPKAIAAAKNAKPVSYTHLERCTWNEKLTYQCNSSDNYSTACLLTCRLRL